MLSGKLHKDYSVISKLFSETEGFTIEQYVIHQKIEKVKQLLALANVKYNTTTPANPETNIIGGALGYFSAHSSQVKKVVVE